MIGEIGGLKKQFAVLIRTRQPSEWFRHRTQGLIVGPLQNPSEPIQPCAWVLEWNTNTTTLMEGIRNAETNQHEGTVNGQEPAEP